jgi:deoxyadenosine/deoxycytidine kinase
MSNSISNNSEVKYIAVEGVIGAGKTSLAKKIKDRLNAKFIAEQFKTNPFLEKFYADRTRYAFQTQMFFLINRFQQQQELAQEDLFTEHIVSDYIFENELKLYENIYPLLARTLRKPDLVVFLQSGTDRLMFNIKKRNRKIERALSRNYIEELSEAYNHFFFRYHSTPLLIVNSSELDFVNNKEDFNELFKQIFRDDRGFTEYFNPEPRKTI